MKKIIYLLLISTLILSCSSSNDTIDDSILTELLGRWENYQRVQPNQTFDFDECNRDTFLFNEDLSGSYSINTGTLINGNCVGGSGGYGFNYELLTSSSIRLYLSALDVYILHKEGSQYYLNPVDSSTQEPDTSIKLLIRKI